MELRTFIKEGTQVIRVTELAEGSMYRRVAKKSHYDTTMVLYFGYVTGLMSNGEEMVITAMEVASDYNSAELAPRIFTASDDLVLFPVADAAEAREAFATYTRNADRRVEDARKALDEAERKSALLAEVLQDMEEALVRDDTASVVGKSAYREVTRA